MMALILAGLCYAAYLNNASWWMYVIFGVVYLVSKIQHEIKLFQIYTEYLKVKEAIIGGAKEVKAKSDKVEKVSDKVEKVVDAIKSKVSSQTTTTEIDDGTQGITTKAPLYAEINTNNTNVV